MAPQSNQRGIETGVTRSVLESRGLPQSNQRGIETGRLSETQIVPLAASIEPAWD